MVTKQHILRTSVMAQNFRVL